MLSAMTPVRRILPHGRRDYRHRVRFYAAYGSNLDPGRMRAYCPHSPLVGTGWLQGWRLTFGGEELLGDEGSVSTVVEDVGGRVFVALYDIHPTDEEQLDELEGFTAGAYRKLHVRVATLDGEVTAWVYVFDGYEGGLPTEWYLTEIANAAEKAGAPDDYVADLRARPARTPNP
jgi:gamma-glutamylcyclotransferase (GGCT)/AIG2-like uncharacterized protein YtfP